MRHVLDRTDFFDWWGEAEELISRLSGSCGVMSDLEGESYYFYSINGRPHRLYGLSDVPIDVRALNFWFVNEKNMITFKFRSLRYW